MAEIIPLASVAAQVVSVLLAQQDATILVRQLRTGLYLNLEVGGTKIVGLVICRNGERIVRNKYLGFSGDLFFIDTLGRGEDPDYTGLGDRFQLVFAENA